MKLYTLNYNNYTNRICKSEPTLAAYLAHDATYYVEEDIVNFNYADNINTKQVLLQYNLSTDKDYAILTNDNDEIESRWFILESSYNSRFQYTVSLLRDVLVDFDDWRNATAKVHRGWISNINSPLLFQKEGAGYNQIKKSQQLLYDETKTPWVVAYIDPNDSSYSSQIIIETPTAYDQELNMTLAAFQSAHANGIYENPEYAAVILDANFWGRSDTSEITNFLNGYIGNTVSIPRKTVNYMRVDSTSQSIEDRYVGNFKSSTLAQTKVNGVIADRYDSTTFHSYENKIIKFSDGSVRRIKINDEAYENTILMNSVADADLVRAAMQVDPAYTQINGNFATFEYEVHHLTYQYEEVDGGQYKLTLPTTYIRTSDCVTPIITFPLDGVNFGITGVPTIDKGTTLAVASALAGKSFIKDVQILPYCPITKIRSNTVNLNSFTINTEYTPIYKGDNIINIIFFVPSSSFSRIINNTLLFTEVPLTIEDTKVANEMKFMRICSPNYNSAYEMEYVKNRNNTAQCISRFNITATYKPYNPYIKVAPSFGGLYGNSFKDSRGLILQGNFSIDKATSAWEQYEAQNKNFERIFNREIESLDLQQSVGKTQDVIGLITGTLQGAGTGIVMGAAGGPIGMAAGAVAGGLASVAGGVTDLVQNNRLRADARDSRQDMFNFQIGNIKASPSTVVASTSFNIDNLYVPFIEFYDATDYEKQLFLNNLTYNGMTVNVVDTISNYISNQKWLAATPIILNGNYDTHTAETIKNELTMGVYVWA